MEHIRRTNPATRPAIAGRAIRRWLWLGALAASALYVATVAAQYLWRAPADYSFVAQRVSYGVHQVTMMLHIGFGIVALAAGLVQFLPIVKPRRVLHRCVGAFYVTSVVIGGIAGLHAATFAHGGASNAVAFTLFSSVWLLTTAMAMLSLVRRNIAAHQLWMKRSYAVTFAAVTFRIELGLLIFVGGLSFEAAYRVVPWTSWMLNLLAVEWIPSFRRFAVPRPLRRASGLPQTVD